MSKTKYYNILPLMRKGATYSIAIGKRSNGKTHSAIDYALRQWVKDGSTCAYIRRWKDDVTGARASQLMADFNSMGKVEKITNGKYAVISYYNRIQYFANVNESNGKIERIEPFMYMFSLTDMEHDKSTQYPNINTIIFDEFIARNGYFPDEFIAFTNLLSTIIRNRDNVRIIMLGNTISKFCPYFQEMGLTNVHKMKQGAIDVYTYGDSKLTVAVEYTGNLEATGASNHYFAFDNPKLSMITKGSWELPVYPHTAMRIKPKDVLFSFFILFNDKTFQGDIVNDNAGLFIHFHEKTTPIQDDAKDLIYCLDVHEQMNYHRNIMQGDIPVRAKIATLIKNEKVFFSNNEVGNYVQSYMRESARNAY